MVSAQAAGEPDGQAAHQFARTAGLQLEERARLSAQGRVPAVLGIRLTGLGRQVPLDAWCKRAMRSRIEPVKKFARTVRAHRELLLNYFRAEKAVLQRRHRGSEQQGQSHSEKSVRLQDLPDCRTLPVSRARQASRAKTRPQILLTKRNFNRSLEAAAEIGNRQRKRSYCGSRPANMEKLKSARA